MKQRAAETIEAIDEILEGGEPGEREVDRLVELLTPGESSPWPDLEAVLHLAEHDVIADDLKRHAVPDRLEEAIGEALEAVLPMLGVRPYGPTFKIAQIARREYEAESEKFELVAEKLEAVASDDGARIAARYLDTDPAPMFVNRMRNRYPEMIDEATDVETATHLAAVDDREGLADRIAALDLPLDAEARDVIEELEAIDSPAPTATEALASDDWRELVLGGALMGIGGLSDLASTALRRVTEGSRAAPLLAVFAARTAPERTRYAISTFLAEVSWQNPELPEAELTESRVRAILSARAVLPRVGSPMEPVDAEELPSLDEHDQLRSLPDRIDGFWEAWDELRDRHG